MLIPFSPNNGSTMIQMIADNPIPLNKFILSFKHLFSKRLFISFSFLLLQAFSSKLNALIFPLLLKNLSLFPIRIFNISFLMHIGTLNLLIIIDFLFFYKILLLLLQTTALSLLMIPLVKNGVNTSNPLLLNIIPPEKLSLTVMLSSFLLMPILKNLIH